MNDNMLQYQCISNLWIHHTISTLLLHTRFLTYLAAINRLTIITYILFRYTLCVFQIFNFLLKMLSPLENSSCVSVVKKPAVVANSWSHTAHEPEVKHKHVWSVESFSEKMKIENKKLILSKEFTISIKDISTRWSLALYPNGWTEDSVENISIFLVCFGNPPFPIRSNFVISIVRLNLVKIWFS